MLQVRKTANEYYLAAAGLPDQHLLPQPNDQQWEANVKARYFIYKMHSSKEFLITNSLASSLS